MATLPAAPGAFPAAEAVELWLFGRSAAVGARQRIAERHDFGFRRIAETGIRASLISHGKSRAGGGVSQRDRHGQALAVNFAFTVKLVLMPLACRQRGGGKRRIGGRQLYLFTVKIVTIFDLPGQIKIVLILLKIEGKSLVSRNKVRTARGVEQAGNGRSAAKQQDQRNDALSHER